MFKFIKILFTVLFTVVIIAAVALIVFIKTFDLNKYKPMIEKLVYEQTGRQLSLKGDAGLKISLIPTVVVNDIALSNAPWSANQNMIEAQSVEVSVAVLPLLHKEVIIDNVSLVKPQIYLEKNKSGVANWEFSALQDTTKPEDKTQQTQAASVAPEAVAAAPVLAGIFAKNFTITDASLIYNDNQASSVTELKINDFKLSSESMDSNVNIAFDVIYNGEDINGTAEIGSINSLLQKTEEYPLKADVKAFGVTAQAEAMLYDLFGNLSFKASVTANNPSGNFGAPQISINTALSGNLQKMTAVLNNLNVNGNVITGTVNADLSQSKPYVNANLQSNKIDVESLTAKATKTAFGLGLIPAVYAAEFIPATPLDLQSLNLLNADVKLQIATLVVNKNLQADNVILAASLKNGVLTVNPLSLNAGDGSINGNMKVDANNNTFSADLSGKDVILQKFWKELAVSNDKNFGIISGGKTNLKIKLNSQGSNLRQLAENLNGQVIGIVDESEMQTGALKYLTGNFVSQLLKSLNLERKQKNLQLSCAVVRGDIKQGNITFPKGIVFNSPQVMVVSNGTVNLKNDKIDLTINPFSGNLSNTNIAQAISSLVKIAGTIENPKIAIDESAVIKNIIGVATTGPAFLGSQLVLDVDPAPCYTALKGTEYQNMFPAPSGVKATGQKMYQDTGQAISDGVKAITDTAKDGAQMVGTGAKDGAKAAGNAAVDGIDMLTNTAKDVINMFKRN